MTAPTLDEVVAIARSLADDVAAILQSITVPVGNRNLERRIAVLDAQLRALRAMDPDAVGFLPQRLTWSNGQAVSVVLPSALRRLVAADLIPESDVDRCVVQVIDLAVALQRYETT